ncbi:MAG: hypothetical protein H6727_04890 [Myxococcales bacterium]|nr:hypothetical protein [Myxococcales bacterium]
MLKRWIVCICLLAGLGGASCYLDPDVQCVTDADCRTRFLCKNSLCVCSAGLEQCGVDCVDLNSNANHCGACNNVCTGATPRCACPEGSNRCQTAGSKPSCVEACPAGQTDCGTACVSDFPTNKDHCGECGNECRTDQVCSAGECKCESSAKDCGGACVDITKSADHCGACNNPCVAGQACRSGKCEPCPKDDQCGGGVCADRSSDVNHCGTCNNKCGQDETCCNGSCKNLKTDPKFCGSCDRACRDDQNCDRSGGDGLCRCPSGKEDCLAPVSACVDVLTDAKNCGQCGKSCPTESPVCIEGICCKTGENACAVGGGKVCADLNKDPENCGTCGTSCNGQICEGMACKKCTSDAQCGTGLTCDVGSGRCLCGSGCLWNKTLSGSKASVWVLSVAVSASQDVYVGGEFSGTMRTEDGNTYASQGATENPFIARLDSAGKVKWVRTIPVAGEPALTQNKRVRLAVGTDGSVYVAMTISGAAGSKVTVSSGLSQLSLQGEADLFVGKLDQSGAWQWAVSAGGPSTDNVQGLALGTNGSVFVAGTFKKTVGFGNITLEAKDHEGKTSETKSSLYVAKLNASTGAFENVVSPAGEATLEALVVHGNDQLYITGQCHPNTQFGVGTPPTNPTKSLYVAKLDSSLKFLSAQVALGGGEGMALALTSSGGVVMAGTYGAGGLGFHGTIISSGGNANYVVAGLRETNDEFEWAWHQEGHSTKTLRLHDLLTDKSGISRVALSYDGEIHLGGSSQGVVAGGFDGIVLVLDSQGTPLSKQYTMTGPGEEVPFAMAMDAAGSLYLVGYFSDSLSLQPTNPVVKLDPIGDIDSFFWKVP